MATHPAEAVGFVRAGLAVKTAGETAGKPPAGKILHVKVVEVLEKKSSRFNREGQTEVMFVFSSMIGL